MRRLVRALTAAAAVAIGSAATLAAQPIDQHAAQQIQALLQEKRSRTPAQQKVNSNLLYEAKQRRGLAIASGVPTLRTGIVVGIRGEVVVDITGSVTDSLLSTITALGGRILDSYPAYRSIRAELPLAAVETLAAHTDVLFVQPKQEAVLYRAGPLAGTSLASGTSSSLLPSVRPGFTARAATVRSQLSAALKPPIKLAKVNTSQGVVTHRADLAMSTFGVTGAGVKVGVLSDGVDSLATLQGSGDLPAGVTVLAGQAGSGDEGSAMLEIIYDMAPGAQLYFATALNGIASFAQNIHDLRTAGCDIIIDDVGYPAETPFQEGQTAGVLSSTNGGLVTQAVNDVTAAGALYFSSAANSGGKDKGTSGTWEGDFLDGGADPIEGGRLHDFGGLNNDQITASGGPTILFWSDPLGGSANDYDLFILNSTGTVVLASSINPQNGTQDPFEFINGSLAGDRIVIVKFSGAARFLHLDTSRGELTFNTQGSTRGHNAPPSANAFSVAATPAAAAHGPPPNPTGPYPNPFNSSNHIEIFSSDGPRQYFFNADSSAITPGNFSSSGGVILQKPDITAADGVSCAAPGPFNPFYGTSAAAPHAGAIAALVKSGNLSLTATQISAILTSSAIDIEAAGWDRDSGVGILDAFAAVLSVCPPPSAVITAPASVAAFSTGNVASVPSAGAGATYVWGITNGTITAGAGTRSIVFSAAAKGPVGLTVTVQTSAGCSADGSASVTVIQPNRVFLSTTGSNSNNCSKPSIPCLDFAGALGQVAPGGELIALKTGPYGPLNITQPVTISGPPGIVIYSGHQVTVNAPGATVVLRGLTIDGTGANENGINVVAVGILHVESCVITGFTGSSGTGNGISFTSGGQLLVKDSILRSNAHSGIWIAPAAGSAAASIDHCRLESNGSGLFCEAGAVATVRQSTFSGNTATGCGAEGASTAELNIESGLIANNATGVASSGGATVRASNCTVTDNVLGPTSSTGGSLLSRGNNTVEGNGTDGTFSGSFSAK